MNVLKKLQEASVFKGPSKKEEGSRKKDAMKKTLRYGNDNFSGGGYVWVSSSDEYGCHLGELQEFAAVATEFAKKKGFTVDGEAHCVVSRDGGAWLLLPLKDEFEEDGEGAEREDISME